MNVRVFFRTSTGMPSQADSARSHSLTLLATCTPVANGRAEHIYRFRCMRAVLPWSMARLFLWLVLCAACGSRAAEQPPPTHAATGDGSCAQLNDAAAVPHAAALAAANNVLAYEAAWKQVHPAAALGGLGAAEIRGVVREHTDELRVCYEQALSRVEQAQVRVVVRFVIDPDGHVATAHLAPSELGMAGVGCCVVQRVAAWRFLPPREGGYAVVEYPFTVRLSH
jgi:TonB family protein